jgi:hypothetical protein
MPFRVSFLSLLLSSLLMTTAAEAQNVLLKGAVKGENGAPIPFASIAVNKSQDGTKADSMGIFAISAGADAILKFSAVGFEDTIINVNGRTSLYVMLRSTHGQVLDNAVVSTQKTNSGVLPPEETANEQVITNTLQDYARSSMFSNGAFVGSSYDPAARGAAGLSRVVLQGFGPLNSINSGEMLPVVEHKDATKGSRYLLSEPAHGVIVDENNQLMVDSSRLLNYDKIDGQLLIFLGTQNVLEIDKNKVNAFALRSADTSYVFLKAPVIDIDRYFILVAYGPASSVSTSLLSARTKRAHVQAFRIKEKIGAASLQRHQNEGRRVSDYAPEGKARRGIS